MTKKQIVDRALESITSIDPQSEWARQAEELCIPGSIIAAMQGEQRRMTAAEVMMRQCELVGMPPKFIYMSGGLCQPHRTRKHVDCRVVEPLALPEPKETGDNE